MTDTTKVPSLTIEEDGALAYSHVQELAQIQSDIQALRLAIPALIGPLLRGSGNGTPPAATTPATKTEHKIQDTGAEFREKATKVQGDVAALVKNLERICDTLESAEKVRNDDSNDLGDLQAIQNDLQRTNVVKEPNLSARPIAELDDNSELDGQSLAPAIPAGGDFIFTNVNPSRENGHDAINSSPSRMNHSMDESKHGAVSAVLGMDGMQDFQDGAFDDFGIDTYGQDWTNFTTSE